MYYNEAVGLQPDVMWDEDADDWATTGATDCFSWNDDHKHCVVTDPGEDPFVYIDLESEYQVARVAIATPKQGAIAAAGGMQIVVSDNALSSTESFEAATLCATVPAEGFSEGSLSGETNEPVIDEFVCTQPVTGRYVGFIVWGTNQAIDFCEAMVFSSSATAPSAPVPSPCPGDLCAAGPIEVERNNIIGSVDISNEMHFELDFTVTEWPSSGWGGLFQCGSGRNDRYPLVMVNKNSGSKGFYTWFRDGAGTSATGGYSTVAMELGQQYHLEIDFTQSELTVSLDNVVVLQKAKGTHSVQSQVPCGVFSNNWNAATATVSNIIIADAEDDVGPSPCSGDLCAPGPIEVERNNFIGFVDLLDAMHFEFDFTVTEWPSSGWGGLLQCGSGNNDRYPLVMVQPNSNTLGFYTWFRDGEGASATGGYSNAPLQLNQEYHLDIDFTQSELTVSLDDVVVLQKAKGTHSVQSQVPCGVFSNNFNAATATVSNLMIGPPLSSSDGSAMQSHTASGEQSAAATTEWSSSLVVGMVAVVAFGVGAMSAVALLKLKQNRQKKAATGPAHEERVPEVSMSAVPETTPKEEKRETV